MKKELVLKILVKNGFVLIKEKAFQYFDQLVFSNGAIVCVYHKGTVTPQGRNFDLVNKHLGLNASAHAHGDKPNDEF